MSGLQYDTQPKGRLRNLRIAVSSAAIILLFTGGLMGSAAMDLLAQTFGFNFLDVPILPAAPEPKDGPGRNGFRLSSMDIHPDLLHADFFGPHDVALPTDPLSQDIARDFEKLLSMYSYRQKVDDNFTARAYDIESGDVLGVAALEMERQRFAETGEVDWQKIDRRRRRLTSDLVDDLVNRGYLRDDIRVRWGRRDQVLEARSRDLPYLEHEVRLARYLGLSLLATEIGTVETFNDDRLVSRAGARSRYQMMPAMLRARGVHHYRLATRGGTDVEVREEWHPLISMRAAFIVARAYSNAVGHEIPGLSAYHTGPYNIFRIYRAYLTSRGDQLGPTNNVVSGFLWALTRGFEEISRNSSFKNYSRGYVPTLYASLRATDTLAVDTTETLFAEQIRLRAGQSLYLSDLLRSLDGADERLAWRSVRAASVYDRFRVMNPHFDLPAAAADGSVPVEGDVLLVDRVAAGGPVRFFLPLGSTQELRTAGVDEIDYDATLQFDRSTFDFTDEPLMLWDRLYAGVVDDVRGFGFTFENRARLGQIVRQLEDAAAASPTLYRLTIRDIARLHERVWASQHFDKLAQVVRAARGRLRMQSQPPDLITGDDVDRPETLAAAP